MVGPLCHQSGSFCIYPELDLCPVLLPPANWDVCGEFHDQSQQQIKENADTQNQCSSPLHFQILLQLHVQTHSHEHLSVTEVN